MWPLWVSVVFAAIMASYTAMDAPQRQMASIQIAADVASENFIAYRSAVIRYLNANPAATGEISDTALQPYYKPGYKRNEAWTNIVVGNSLFVYAKEKTINNILENIHNKSIGNILIGNNKIANGNSVGRLISYNGFDTGIDLPSIIPANAIVMAGR